MFNHLFSRPAVQARHRAAPCADARAQFLEYCAKLGYSQTMLRKIAWVLFVLVQDPLLCDSNVVTRQQLTIAVDHRATLIRRSKSLHHATSSRQLFLHFAIEWCRFRNCLASPALEPPPYEHYIDQFVSFMCDERGLSPETIATRNQQVTHFFTAVWHPEMTLSQLSIHDVDAYLSRQGTNGWSRASLHTLASTLRCFFRYAEGQAWCHSIATGIEAPRLFAREGLPLGPTWGEVQHLMDCTRGCSAADIRDYAVLQLLAVYGLRRSEVARLRLEDVDWTGELLRVQRPKQRCWQKYPLVAPVGHALLRYLQEARPASHHRTLFLALHPPIRPLSPNSITAIAHARLTAAGITTPRCGAHCLRHACARHLLDSGLTLEQVGDHLGHRNASTTRHYGKVDLRTLREVADIDLGGVK